MGRPKGYDRTEVLESAMELFWRQGFEGTSTQQLVEHLGINRNSMYSEFGSKRDFFETALAHYEELWIAENLRPLEQGDAGVEVIQEVFRHYASIGKKKLSGMGCMLANATVEFGSRDGPSRDVSQRFIGRAQEAFLNALTQARDAGALARDVDVAGEAAFLTSSWLGMLVLSRGKAPAKTFDGVAARVAAHLAALGRRG